MSYNRFSASATAVILKALAMSPSLDTINDINLAASADFSQEDSHEALADLLATAPNLTMCNIGLAEGTKIQVEVTYGDSAMVKVTNQESGEFIERDTNRVREVKLGKDRNNESDDDRSGCDSEESRDSRGYGCYGMRYGGSSDSGSDRS